MKSLSHVFSNSHLLSYLKDFDEEKVRKTYKAANKLIEETEDKKRLCEDRMEAVRTKAKGLTQMVELTFFTILPNPNY